MKKNYLFFDNASTTRCCESAAQLVQQFATEVFGNPSSSHVFGQEAARAIKEARQFFGGVFKVDPGQVVFTGSGTEADNLAVYGVAMSALADALKERRTDRPRILASSMEHPAVRKTVRSLDALGIETFLIPVDSEGRIQMDELEKLLTPSTVLVSIQQVNNIVGSVFPVEELARFCKSRVPGVIFHTDAVQSFGKVNPPTAGSAVDLVSISGHKVHGPKGVGALIVLNKQLLKSGLRPLIWGGEQEFGFRSGTQNAGLIAGFHAAAKETLANRDICFQHVEKLHHRFKELLLAKKLLNQDVVQNGLHWNSPDHAVPHIVNLSFPGYPSALFAKLLEDHGCLVSTGSACSSQKAEPDAVLTAMGLAPENCASAIRVSFAATNRLEDVEKLVNAMDESIQALSKFLAK